MYGTVIFNVLKALVAFYNSFSFFQLIYNHQTDLGQFGTCEGIGLSFLIDFQLISEDSCLLSLYSGMVLLLNSFFLLFFSSFMLVFYLIPSLF